MKIIDFNDSFDGFEDEEDIFVDTSIFLGLLNKYDAYNTTTSNLFKNYILDTDINLYLYVNPTTINEITYLSKTPLKQYFNAFPDENRSFSVSDQDFIQNTMITDLKDLIISETIGILDGNKESVLNQINTFKILGAADATYASIANLYGTNFLTVDRRLAENIFNNRLYFSNIEKVYYTTGRHRDYWY